MSLFRLLMAVVRSLNFAWNVIPMAVELFKFIKDELWGDG